jgi:transcriptional regulator with XRE-family HTH domain
MTTEMIFWGEKGEYGPFTRQEDGWPHTGEVIRHYRRKNKISAEELARLYGEAIHTQVTARWILKMEQQNKVPTDITRRRILASILEIPPFLLGLTSLESITFAPTIVSQQPQPLSAPSVLRHASLLDLASYEQYAQAHWLLSYTGAESLAEVVSHIADLEQCERESSGNFQRTIRQVLNSHYQLASDMARHQGNFVTAWQYANQAVRVTRLLSLNDFLAAALYRRGYTTLEWALFGDQIAQGIVNREADKGNLNASLTDFAEALPLARPQLKGAIWLEMSRAQGLLQHTTLSLSLLSQAATMVDAGSSLVTPHDQILLEGALNGLNEGMYLLGKTASLIALGRTTTAIDVLDDLEDLKNGKGIARNQARRLAYADLLRAEASLGTHDYITAAVRATSAFQTYRDIQTIERIAWINTIHQQLAQKYGSHPEVKHLGKLLADYYHKQAKRE